MLVPISMGTNMAAGNRKKHLEFTFASRPNLVPRVLWLFGQRKGASRDSGIMEKDNFFDWTSG